MLKATYIQVVEKHSALLDLDQEDQIPVNASHIDMCKFEASDDDVYNKLNKRVKRMVKANRAGAVAVST